MKKSILFLGLISMCITGCDKKNTNVNPFIQGYKNIVDNQTVLKSAQAIFSESENLEKVFDTDLNTKFLVAHPKNTITIKNTKTSVLKKYEITSANDAPGRDPKNWILRGTTDGVTWDILDVQNNQKFEKRGFTKSYDLGKNTKAYSAYKFDLEHSHKSTHGDNYLQIAEINLVALTDEPVTKFTSNLTRAKITDTLYFKDISANAPDSWQWNFENGTPATSMAQNPTVVFKKPGNHTVTLITKNEFGVDTLRIKRNIKVYDPKDPWKGFYYPEITLTPKDTVSEGYKRAIAVIPDFKEAINEVTLGVCKQLYRNISEIPDFEKVNFTFEWSNRLAAKGGNPTSMELWFSTKYIHNALKNEPDDLVLAELYGVLWHELTHGYQFVPSTVDDTYRPGYDYFAFLEGEADLVRINAGYHKTRNPDLGYDDHKYLSGYTTSGFFLKWIVDTYDSDFIYKFNQSVQTINPWSYKAAIKQILDKDIEVLWEEYATYVATYSKTHTVEKSEMIDWKNM